ncbi:MULTISPECIES: hypothetical protein [Bradyrhizobium]|uniref:hypothetical protein n=1 Tax=Bradyrhizobium TaxID=374 RepID=UPI0005501B77|nr:MULTISPECIES: hypothetical protein [Bradyrhizobium]WLB86183.1 hypothetical protein QIH91_25010 [Bradyrhizobium japonicum USDA 135]
MTFEPFPSQAGEDERECANERQIGSEAVVARCGKTDRVKHADPRIGELVLHFVTVTGENHYFGLSLRDAVNLLLRWQHDVKQIASALAEGTAISCEVEVSTKPTVN